MTDWNYIQSGYNALDQTINFGTRIIGGLDNLYETSTLAVVTNPDGDSSALPVINSLINNGSVFFSINKSLRIFQDLNCTELSLNITFEDIIDTFCVTSNGTLLCICFRNGCVSLFHIENEPRKLFETILYENENMEQPFFIKAVPVESKTNLTFYIVTSGGKIHRIAQPYLEEININIDDNSDSYTDNLAIDLNKPIQHVNLLSLMMCCTSLEEVFICNMALDRMTSFCISGIKKMHLCNIRFCLGLTCDGRSISVCTKTGLKLATNIKAVFEDMILIHDKDDTYILGIVNKNEIGISDIILLTYPGYKTMFSLKLCEKIHNIIPENIHDEIMYISEIREGEIIKELRFQIISETAPENRLQRLLRRQKFNEAEQFAKLFSLDLTEIQRAKAQVIVDKSSCNETDVTDLIEILNGIGDNEFKIACCLNTHSSCTNLKDVERILKYMNSVSLPESSADSEDWEVFGPELMFQFHTFLMLGNAGYLKNSAQDWYNFSTCDVISQMHTFVEENQIEEFKILYSRLDAVTVEKLNQTDIVKILDNVNKLPLGSQLSFLNAFVPLTLTYLPSSLTTFVKWLISSVYYIEKTYFDAFPNNALTFLNQMVVLLKLDCANQLDFRQYTLIDPDLLKELENMISTLTKLEALKSKHRIVIPLQHLQQDAKILFPGLLKAFAKNETFLIQFIEKFVQPHQDDVFGEIIKDIVKYHEECWAKVVAIILQYMTSLTKKLEASIIVIRAANIPWCEDIRTIASNCIRCSHPLVKQIIHEIELERKSSILRKEPYRIIVQPCDDSPSFQQLAVHRILYCNEPSMLQDIYDICKGSVKKTIEADVLITHHFIKKGDFGSAINVLDHNCKSNTTEVCRRLVMFASSAIDNEYNMESLQENYYEMIGSIFSRLQQVECTVKKQGYRKTLERLRNVYHIQRRFNIKVICDDFIEPVEKNLLKRLVAIVIDEYNQNNDIGICIGTCEKIASYLKLDCKVVLIELCKQIGDYNVVIDAAEVLHENTDDPKSLCAMATLLLVGIGSPIIDLSRLCAYESTDLQPFAIGLKLARKLMVKAVLKSSQVNLFHCLELANWTEMTYFLTQNGPRDKMSNNDSYISNTITSSLSLFNSIKTVFKFYMHNLDTSRNSHIPSLYVENMHDITMDVGPLQSSIASLCVEGNSYMAYKLIEVLHRNLICIEDGGDSTLCETLHQVLQNCSKQLLHQLFSSISIDINFAFNLLINLNDVAYSKRFLVQSLKQYKRNFVKFETIAQVSLLFLKYNNIEDGQLLCINILCVSKWWKQLKNCSIPYEEFFGRSPSEILLKLIKLKDLSTRMIHKFCLDANLDVKQHYELYLESLLLNWEPQYKVCVNIYGAAEFVMEHDENEFFETCLEVIDLIDSEHAVLELLQNLWNKINFYHYEVFICILDLLSSLSANSDNTEKRMVLSFLNTYNRVGKPRETEIEQWFTLYPDTQSIGALSRWRLPFTPTLLSNKIWSIIRPEINLKTYTNWFKAISIFQNLKQDDICSYVIKDVISSGVFSSKSAHEWLLYPKYEELLQEIDNCVQNINNYELATATLYSLISNIPNGADKVNAAALCYKYACKYQEQCPNSVDVQKAVVKVHRKYLHFSIMHILYLHNLTDKKYLNSIGLPIDELIKTLYMDGRILQKREFVNIYCPDINKAVDELAVLHQLDIEARRIELLNNWLSAPLLSLPFSTKMNISIQRHSLCEYDDESENLVRASYLCMSGNLSKWQTYLLSVGNVDLTESKNLSFKAMALKCFCNISSIEAIEKLTGSTYNAFRNFINKLSLISSLEHFGFCLTIDALDRHNKTELLNRLSYHTNSPTTLKIMASVCVTYTIYDTKYWAIIVTAMAKLNMLQELKEGITFLKKNVIIYNLQWYIDAWQYVINHTLKSIPQSGEEIVRKQCIDNFITIQACPVLFSLNFEPIMKRFLDLKQYDFVALLLQFLNKKEQDCYIKILMDTNLHLCDKIQELIGLGFVGTTHVKKILTQFEHNGIYPFQCCLHHLSETN